MHKMEGNRMRCGFHLMVETVALINKMQTDLVVRTGSRVEKSLIVDAAISDYYKRNFPNTGV